MTVKERRALLILAWIWVALVGINAWMDRKDVALTLLPLLAGEEAAKSPSSRSDRSAPDDIHADHAGQPEQEEQVSGPSGSGNARKAVLRTFDPNIAGREELLGLGMSSRVVNTLLRFREKGGKFRIKSDLSRIYGLSDSLYSQLVPWIRLPESLPEARSSKPRPVVDVNRSDEEEWTWLPGIGSGYAGRICAFRKALGGFVSIDQVAETRGLPDSVFRLIRPWLTFSSRFDPVEVNLWTAEELAAHPYISWKEARILVNYRAQHGPYKSILDVGSARAFPDSTRRRRMEPYWSFETVRRN